MHRTHTFILHLLLDSEQPEVLRGTLQSVSEGNARAFIDEVKLIEILHEMMRQADGAIRLDEVKPVEWSVKTGDHLQGPVD
jgi:hypothetical protein